jgi:hypothetical protein
VNTPIFIHSGGTNQQGRKNSREQKQKLCRLGFSVLWLIPDLSFIFRLLSISNMKA